MLDAFKFICIVITIVYALFELVEFASTIKKAIVLKDKYAQLQLLILFGIVVLLLLWLFIYPYK